MFDIRQARQVHQDEGITLSNAVAMLHHGLVFRRRVRVLSDILAKLLPKNASILDIGTGDGSIAARIMERRGDVKIEGVDVVARSKTQIPVKLFDGYRLPFPDGSFDCAMFVDVLHHTLDPDVQIIEAARVSRKHILIKDHLLEGVFAGPTLRCMDWFGNWGHAIALPYNYLSRSQWEKIFNEAGLKADTWIDRLGLYPAPMAWLFEGKLHFVSRLVRNPSGPSI